MTHLSALLTTRIVPLMLALMLTGCLEYETTTTVRTDGSFLRTITVKGDSAAIFSWDFMIPADSTWTVLERTRAEEKKWVLRAERSFSGSDAWTMWADDLHRRTLRCSVTVEKQFRFFTTRYRFTETIASYNPFTLVPLTDFISPTELDMFLRFEVMKESYPSRGDSLALEDAGDRFEEWEVRTRVESFFRAIERNLDPAAGLDSVRRAGIKEKMVQHYLKDGKESNYTPEGIRSWAKGLREPAIVRAVDAGEQELESLKKDIDYLNSVGGDSYASRVEMPGEITYTNGKLEGTQTASWDNYIAYAYVSDFPMVAESSMVNLWAIILTLGVIVGAPILVWVGWMVRRKRERGE